MKKSPLSRKSELKRSGFKFPKISESSPHPLPWSADPANRYTLPKRTKPLKARGKNYRPVPDEVKAIVLDRAKNCCERCGSAFGERNPAEFHHVLKRRHVKEDDPALIRSLCHLCHLWTEAEPLEAEAAGFFVRGNWLRATTEEGR